MEHIAAFLETWRVHCSCIARALYCAMWQQRSA